MPNMLIFSELVIIIPVAWCCSLPVVYIYTLVYKLTLNCRFCCNLFLSVFRKGTVTVSSLTFVGHRFFFFVVLAT